MRTLLLLGTGFFLMLFAQRLVGDLTAQPEAAEAAFPMTHVLDGLMTLMRTCIPLLVGLFCVAASWFILLGDSVGMGHRKPLTDDMRGSRDRLALRAVLRRVRDWLAQQDLPAVAGPLAESIGLTCREIDRQLEQRDHEHDAAELAALHKLLTVELATLVLRYQRVPPAQRLLPYLNASANDILLSGLRAVDDQLRAVHEALSKRDLHDLHVQARYLELKSASEAPTEAFAPAPLRSAPTTANTTRVPATTIPATTSSGSDASSRHEPQGDGGLSMIEVVGVAAATTLVAESLLHDEAPLGCQAGYSGESGEFGGGGASGEWSGVAESEFCGRESDCVDLDESS